MSRVLILGDDVFSKGGISRYTRYQLLALKNCPSVEAVFLFSLYPDRPENKFEEEIDVAYIGSGASFTSKLKYLFAVLRFVKKNKINFIVSIHLQLSIVALVAKFLFGVRYSTNIYGLEVWGRLRTRDKLGFLSSDSLIGDCNFILDYVKRNFDYQADMVLMHDPVNVERFRPISVMPNFAENYAIPADALIVMTVGRLERNKGHKIMIEALPHLPDNVCYVAVGGGFMEKDLKDLAKKYNVSNRVVFTGRVPEDDLVPLYNLADVILLLSTFGAGEGEGLPLGLIEGSACSKAIICGDQDGSAEAYNRDDPNGYLISPVDVGAVVDIINRYLAEPELLEKHGAAGRKYVLENFNFEDFQQKMCKFISAGD